jgi:hypothetical protein
LAETACFKGRRVRFTVVALSGSVGTVIGGVGNFEGPVGGVE